MEKAIATVLLTIAAVAAIGAIINSMMPAISRTSASIVASSDSAGDRISTQVEIIHATGANGSPTIDAWTKNVGGVAIAPLNRVDVFFGPQNDFVRVPYGGSGCAAPCWSYSMENDTAWNPTATLHITITMDANLVTNTTYFLKVVAPNGVSDARFFTV